MHRIIREQYIVSLVVKEMLETICEEEKAELKSWLSESEDNQKAYEQLKGMKISRELEYYRRLDSEKGWKRYKSLYSVPERKIITRWRWLAVASVLVLFIGIGGGILQRHEPVMPGEITGNPGDSRAVLILSDGTVKNLIPHQTKEVLHVGELIIRNDGTSIRYEKSDTIKEIAGKKEIKYNELRVPTGGEFQLVLADGTHVWLNSETTLRYPLDFNGGVRKVKLEGEAYFEVSRDEKRPFWVEIREGIKVEVLGTSFNVRAYGDEAMIETVLEKGAVKMWQKEKYIELMPGMRAFCDGSELKKDTVDTELYTAWRSGHYIFREETVGNILHKLSRWYNVEIFYANQEAKDVIFSGSVKKYDTIRNLLKAMEAAGGIHFELSGNTVVVSCRNKKNLSN